MGNHWNCISQVVTYSILKQPCKGKVGISGYIRLWCSQSKRGKIKKKERERDVMTWFVYKKEQVQLKYVFVIQL